MCVPIFLQKNLALGENFLSPTLNIIQPIFQSLILRYRLVLTIGMPVIPKRPSLISPQTGSF